MFKSLRPDFNLKQLVMFIAAIWLQTTVLIILCCISSPQMARPSDSDKVDTLLTQAVSLQHLQLLSFSPQGAFSSKPV
jgi:hypothetical protein